MIIQGRVIDSSGAPIEMVVIHDEVNSTMTNQNGEYSLESDQPTIYAYRVGYVSAQNNASTWLEFMLQDDQNSNLNEVEIIASAYAKKAQYSPLFKIGIGLLILLILWYLYKRYA